MMKRNLLYFILPFLAGLVSCNQDLLGVMAEPVAEDSMEIHFIQESLVKEFTQETSEGEFTVVLARNGNVGTYRVALKMSGKDAGLFSFDEMVVIPDGEYSVEIPVKVDMTGVVLGASIKASLYIIGRDVELGEDASYISQYSDFIDLSASFMLEWEPLMRTTEDGVEVQQTATFLYTQFYTGSQSGMLVEKAKGTDNIFRLLDWAAGTTFLFKRNSDGTVVVPGQSIGYLYDGTNEYVQVSDIAQYLGDETYYNSYPCWFDGKQTYTLNLIYYVSDGIFAFGEEKIIFASDDDDNPVVEAEYAGDGKFLFEFNENTSYCKAVVLEGDITSDQDKIDDIYKSICLGTYEGVTTFSSNEQAWAPSTPSNTLLVVPFDKAGIPGNSLVIRFTYDPEGKYAVKVNACKIEPYEKDAYTTLTWTLSLTNAASVRFILMEKDVLDYYEENYPMDQILGIGSVLGPEEIKTANEGELVLYYQNLKEGATYRIIAEIANKFGDVILFSDYTVMQSHASQYKECTIDDFIGSYIVNADVTTSENTEPVTESFRVDIIKTSAQTVSIKGLSNDSNYSPSITGTFNQETYSIVLKSQNLGEYSYLDVVFGFVANLYSGIWNPRSSMEFGFAENGYVYWRSSADSEEVLTGYRFLLFDEGSFTSYSVGDKTYQNIIMQKLTN